MNGSTTGSSLVGLLFVLVFSGLILGIGLIWRERGLRGWREIRSFTRLKRSIGLAVEAGQRLHVMIGDGGIQGLRGAAGLIGLSLLQKMTRSAAVSDRPPTASSGEPLLAILSEDALRSGYREINAESRFEPASAQLAGLSAFGYAAGCLPVIYDQQVATNLIIGSFGTEVGLLTDAAGRTESLTIGGSDNLPAQAILYASTDEPLVGEELYAAGAYLQVNKFHLSSLFAQDVLRWLLIGLILVGALLKFVGGL